MVREYTGASSEGATCAWMAADEAVGRTRAFLTMWLSSRRLEHSGSNYKLVTLTLEGAINKITGNPEGNIEQISRLYHSLIQVLFFTQEYVASSVEEENLNVCKTLFKMLENDSIFQEYPETKVSLTSLDLCKCEQQLTDEAHFWLNGYVNKQNCRIWSEANPQVYVETPLNPEKLTVWCALWAGGILLQKR
ncbi:testis-expressed protein 11 [Trichonephila clavipes]|uniref:Testis-expressed protein 11 n=1 Tax=Trichonephila clavipes TaxID=2585209 RepID=A0A8X6R350_TRICX|nr:testis-expressed protein 11 [Trichonephila clavipes]